MSLTKTKLLMAGLLLAGVFVSLSGVVQADPVAQVDPIYDPDCDGHPYPNNFRINGFYAGTPDSNMAGESSSLISGGVVCGTIMYNNLFDCGLSGQEPPQGKESLNTHIEVKLPQGVDVHSTDDLPEGAYAGISTGNAALCGSIWYGIDSEILPGSSVIRVQRDRRFTDCPPSAISCYIAESELEGYLAWGYSWVEQEADGTYTLVTGEQHNNVPVTVYGGVTQYGVNLCAFVGSAEGDACGDGSDPSTWQQTNGDPTEDFCRDGKGLVEMRVRNERGDETDPAVECIQWRSPTDADCDGDPYDNTRAVHDFGFTTSDPWAREVSGISFGGLYCGTDISGCPPFYGEPQGEGTLAHQVDVVIPTAANVEVNLDQDSDIADRSYVGSMQARVASWVAGQCEQFLEPDSAVISKVTNSPADDCPDTAIGCYKASFGGDFSGYNYNWIEPKAGGGYSLSIGKLHNSAYGNYPAGVTKIDEFSICGFAGEVDADQCGDGSDYLLWLQRNGDTAASDCGQSQYDYTMTVTDKRIRVTDPVSTCVSWQPVDTTITSKPAKYVINDTATFEFDSNVPQSQFECKLDADPWQLCLSPRTYQGLSSGRHNFSVRATGKLADNPDSSPASYNWDVMLGVPKVALNLHGN